MFLGNSLKGPSRLPVIGWKVASFIQGKTEWGKWTHLKDALRMYSIYQHHSKLSNVIFALIEIN